MPPFRWAVVLTALVICLVGALYSGIFKQSIWDPIGQQRFLTYAAIFAIAAGLLYVVRPMALLPGFLGAAVVYAAVVTGPQTPFALLYFTLACYGIGRGILRLLHVDSRGLHTLGLDTLSVVTGAGIWGFVVSFLAFTTWNRPATHALLLAAPAVAASRSIALRAYRALQIRRPGGRAKTEYWAIAVLLFALGAQFLMCLKPEVSADGIAVHLVVPMHVAVHGGWHFDVSQITWAVTPMTAEWCYTTLYLLGGEYAAKLLPFVFLALSCLLIVALCRRLVSRPAALLIAAVYAATPVVQLITGSMFVDMIWATFLLGTVLLIVHWTDRRDHGVLLLSGILLGAAMATKFVAIAFVVPCLAWVLFQCLVRNRGAMRRSISALLQTAALCALIGCPPYLTAWLKTGNPVFPYFNDVFRSPHYDTGPDWEDGRWKTRFTWHAPLDITFRSGKFLESQDGALGLSWLFLTLLLLTAPRSMFTRQVIAALLIGLCFFLLTWSRASYLRYLVPAFPPLLFGFAAYLRALQTEQANLYRTVMALTVATILAGTFLLPSSGYWHKNFCLSPFHFKQEAAEYVQQNAPARFLVQYLNRRASGEPVAFFWIGIAGLKGRPYTSGSHTFDFFRQCEMAQSAEAVRDLMSRNRIRYFVTPLPKCGAPNMPQLTQFIQRYTQEQYRSGCLYVAEMNDNKRAAKLPGREMGNLPLTGIGRAVTPSLRTASFQ